MGVDLSLLAVPKEGKLLTEKSRSKFCTEYKDLLFFLHGAYKKDFVDFGHPDWIEFRQDAQELQNHYPNQRFEGTIMSIQIVPMARSITSLHKSINLTHLNGRMDFITFFIQELNVIFA